MATIDKRFIYFQNKEDFNEHYKESTDGGNTYGDLLGTSLVFIENTQEIWTHGEIYKCDINTEKVQELLNSHTFDASKIVSGTIDIDRLPKGALERLIPVANESARFKLTSDDVQEGDTVKELDTGLMYLVIDTSNLDNSSGYEVYTAGLASSVPWSGITEKPSTFTPTTGTSSTTAYAGDKGKLNKDILDSFDITNISDIDNSVGTNGVQTLTDYVSLNFIKKTRSDISKPFENKTYVKLTIPAATTTKAGVTTAADKTSLSNLTKMEASLANSVVSNIHSVTSKESESYININVSTKGDDGNWTNKIQSVAISKASSSSAGVMTASDKQKLDSIVTGGPYLPLSGGTLTGRISTFDNKGTWINGKGSASIMYNGMANITSDNYHPFFGMKGYSGGCLSFGGLSNKIGFYGYFPEREENGTDFYFTVDTTTGIWNVFKDGDDECLTINSKPIATKEWSNSQFLKLTGGTLTGTLTGTDVLLPYTKSVDIGESSSTGLGSVPISGTIVGSVLNDEVPKYKTFFGGFHNSSNNSWWNIISIRHRNGSGDGNNAGLVLVAPFENGNLTWRTQYNGAWTSARTLYDTQNLATATTSSNGLLSKSDKLIIDNSLKVTTKTIDASSLDTNTYYPVTVVGNSNLTDVTTFEVYSNLNDIYVPWGTYNVSNGNGSYSAYVRWTDSGDGWGSIYSEQLLTIEAKMYRYCNYCPIQNIGQMKNSSRHYFFVRGGGIYTLKLTSRNRSAESAELHTEPYTISEQTISPSTVQLNIPNGLHSLQTSYIYTGNNTGDLTIYPGNDIRVGSWSTAETKSIVCKIGTNYRYPYSGDAIILAPVENLGTIQWKSGKGVSSLVVSEDVEDPSINITSNPKNTFICYTIHFQPVTTFSVTDRQEFNAIINAAGYKVLPFVGE